MKKVVTLTGTELRHTFFRLGIAASEGIDVLRSYCEGLEKSLRTRTEARGAEKFEIGLAHLDAREQSEEDFFSAFVRLAGDRSRPVFIDGGAINEIQHFEDIRALKPDLLAAYGCSLIKGPLLSEFEGRFLNVHLGLSPYYMGSGTNFWALVNGVPEYMGATFMYIDAGVDTGEIIHQIRPRIFPGDTPHQIGNRLIRDVTLTYAQIIRSFDELDRIPQLPEPEDVKIYRIRDFSDEATTKLYEEFKNGLVEKYLQEKEARCSAVPILEHPVLARMTDII